MDHNYTVTITICVLSMIILAIDVGKNTILNKDDIKWFRITFILAALGAICEYLGVLADKTNFCSPKIHWFITFSLKLFPFLQELFFILIPAEFSTEARPMPLILSSVL